MGNVFNRPSHSCSRHDAGQQLETRPSIIISAPEVYVKLPQSTRDKIEALTTPDDMLRMFE